MRFSGEGEGTAEAGRDGAADNWRINCPFLKIPVEYSNENHYNGFDGGKQGAQEIRKSARLCGMAAPSFRLEESNSKNRNEFVEKALRFYMGYLGTENITEFLSDALVATLRGIVADSANRTNSLLFKCAVEQGIMAYTIAAHFRDTMEDRRALRGYVVDEVKRTNGHIKFEDAQDVQRQLPDDTWLE